MPDADILDLYAGTGSLGIEALSRGARAAVFIDKSRSCCSVIEENLLHTRLIDKALIINNYVVDALRNLSNEARKFDIIFLDPPYNKNLVAETLNSIVKNGIIKSGSIIVAEHYIDDKVPEEAAPLKLARSERYGGTVLSFYSIL